MGPVAAVAFVFDPGKNFIIPAEAAMAAVHSRNFFLEEVLGVCCVIYFAFMKKQNSAANFAAEVLASMGVMTFIIDTRIHKKTSPG